MDESLFPPNVSEVEQRQGKPPKVVGDFRRALDDKSIDAIIVATPDHWHALATIWGCQAGKDVYVEKPISHSPWEGRKMVEAARRHDRIVQVGTQNRSAHYNILAKQYIDSGKLGTIHMVRVYNQKEWPNVPALADRDTPAGLNWDMWTGPAPHRGTTKTTIDSWNHFWRFSGGDIINDGVHQMDLARWLTGKTYPKSVYSTGGRYAEKGVLESPDTQVAVFQFDDMVLTFELTLYTPYMLKSDQALRDSDMYPVLAAERRADRNLWEQGPDDRGPAWLRLAGLRPPEGSAAGDRPPGERSVPRQRAPDEFCASACAAARRRTPTSKRAIAARSCASSPTSATGSAAES